MMEQESGAEESDQLEWRPVTWKRLVSGFALSPILPALIASPVIWFMAQHGLSDLMGTIGLWLAYALAVELWSVIAGTLGSLAMFRWRGYISKGGCVLTGTIGGFTLPFATLLAPALLDAQPSDHPMDSDVILGFAVLALGGAILGVLGGWIHWGIVRTQTKSPDVATVFD